MGFFDDLDAEVSVPQGEELERPVELGDYAVVFTKLKEGWVHRLHRVKPDQEPSKPKQVQEVEVAWDPARGKYTWRTVLAETAGRRRGRTLSEETWVLDERALLDTFEQNPWVGFAALEAHGIDRSRPEF